MGKKISVSLIAEETRLIGDIHSDARVVIEGIVEGNIRCPDLTITASGRVSGDIKAGDIAVAGNYSGGNIVAHHKISIHSTGSVEGKVLTRVILMEEGGVLDGEIRVMAPMEEFPEYV